MVVALSSAACSTGSIGNGSSDGSGVSGSDGAQGSGADAGQQSGSDGGTSTDDSGTSTGTDGGPSGGDGSTSNMDAAYPFTANTPGTYVPKVKNLITGLPATAAEIQAVAQDPTAIKGLIDQWTMQPEWRARLMIFFKQAFQQTQVMPIDYTDELALTLIYAPFTNGNFIQMMEEMFPRTALELMDEGRPFTEVVTTRRFMMTPALMSFLAYADTMAPGDDTKPQPEGKWILRAFHNFAVTWTSQNTPIMQSIDPTSSSFMHWGDPTCPGLSFTLSNGGYVLEWLEDFLVGTRRYNSMGCGMLTPMLAAQDFSTWRMVNVRQPGPGEQKTLFWDYNALTSSAAELITDTPRVGFMTTPAFFANWPTNVSNQARATTNQTMIVALGFAFDDRGVTVPVMQSGSDSMHVQPGTACYGCHSTLDPMRDFFRESYTYSYSSRYATQSAGIPTTATFTAFGSTPVTGNGVYALADAIAAHPRFAIAWTQKLCRLANSASCSEDDPEFIRVAQVFQNSNFNFNALVRELFSSPLVTYASPTKSESDNGEVVSIARKDSLCTSLSNRLGQPDICGIWRVRNDLHAANMAAAIPGDSYARGAEAPLMPTDPDLFFDSGTNNLCQKIAGEVVDSGTMPKYSSSNVTDAIHAMVNEVMGLPDSDPRSPNMVSILNTHYMSALTATVTPSNRSLALQSTFVLACLSPLSLGSGL
jgi:hypothetical protein